MNFAEWTKKNKGRTGEIAQPKVTQQETRITPTSVVQTGGGSPSFSEWSRQHRGQEPMVRTVTSGARTPREDLQPWLNDIDAFSKRISGDKERMDKTYQPVETYTAYQTARDAEIDELLGRAYSIQDHFAANRELYDGAFGAGSTGKFLQGVRQNISYLKNVRAGLKNDREFWGQFADEKEYKTYKQLKGYTELGAADRELGQYGAGNIDLYSRPQLKNADGSISTVRSITINEDGKEIVIPTIAFGDGGTPYRMSDQQAIAKYHATGEYLGKFDTQAEAEAYAQKLHLAQEFYYGSRPNKELTTKGEEDLDEWATFWTSLLDEQAPPVYKDSGWKDPFYAWVNGQEAAGAYLKLQDNTYGAGAGALGHMVDSVVGGNREAEHMSPEEIATYNYIYATRSPEEARAFYEFIKSDLYRRQREATQAEWAEWAKEDPVGASVFSVLMAPTKGISYALQLGEYLGSGKIDQNASYNSFSYVPAAIRGQVVQDIEKYWVDRGHEFGGKTASFLYQTGMSMGDFLFTTAVSGGNQTVALAIMGTGAAADATIEAKDRGLSDDQAFALGTIAGIAEVVTEKFSLDALLEGKWEQGAIRYIIKNAFTEGTEEVGSDAINLFADILIAKDKSQWAQAVAAYEAEGMSENEAFWRAVQDQALTMGLDFLGGALSGGVLSGGNVAVSSAINYYQTGKVGKEFQSMGPEVVQAIIETGLESDPSTKSFQIAQQLQAKVEAGETITAQDLGKLYRENVLTIEQEEQAEAAQQEAETNIKTAEHPTGETVNTDQPVDLVRPEPAGVIESDQQTAQSAQITTESQRVQAPIETEGVEWAGTEEARRGAETQVQEDMGRQDAPQTMERTVLEDGQQQQATQGGDHLHDGDAGRLYGPGAGEQSGRLAGGTVQTGGAAEQGRIAVERQNYAKALRRARVSSAEGLGLTMGTDTPSVTVLEEGDWDAGMRSTAERVQRETGRSVTYVLGSVPIRTRSGGTTRVRGVYTQDGRIIIQADHMRLTTDQIADHEIFHDKAFQTPGLVREIEARITERFTPEEFGKIVNTYIEKLRGVIDLPANADGAAIDAAYAAIMEEIFADAYAGINAFGAHAEQYNETMETVMEERGVGRQSQENAAATDRRTGPPAESAGAQYSVNESFGQELKEWDDTGRPEGERFILGSTGDVLQGLGAVEADIFMEGDKISTILEDHPEMTLEEIRRVPEILDDPVLVMKSQGSNRRGQNTRLVVFGSFRATNGQPIMSVLDLRPVDGGFVVADMQKVNSAYTRDNALNYIKGGEILHADKKRTIPLLRTVGLHGPIELQQSGSMGSISYNGQNVNIQGVPFGDVVRHGELEARKLPRTFQEEVQDQIAGRGEEAEDVDGAENPTEREPKEKFSLEEPVEETKNLVALHNLTADKLLKALALGGFPMPSIAVTKADIPHTNFGDITLVMDKTTIDPKFDRRNMVYSADAWTPTFPATEYEVNEDVAERLHKKFYELQKKFGRQDVDVLYPWGNYPEDQINREGGEAAILAKYQDDPDMMKVYLLDNGMQLPDPVMEETVTRMDDWNIELSEHLISTMGEDMVRNARPDSRPTRLWWQEWIAEHGTELEAAYSSFLQEKGYSEGQIENVLDNVELRTILLNARKYLENGPETRTTREDTGKTEQAIRGMVDPKDYQNWLQDLFGGIEKSSGINTGVDPYTRAGDRKSFRQTHIPATLENIAKVMISEGEGGDNRNVAGFYGVKTLRAVTAERFGSIEDMHRAEGKLQHMTQEQADANTDALHDRLYAIMGDIYKSKPHGQYSNEFMDMDTIGEILVEAARGGEFTPESVIREFKGTGYQVTEEMARRAVDLFGDINKMPVNIFEAKPERAVRFDEVLAAIVPEDTGAELRSKLEEAGVRVVDYQAEDDTDRLEKVNSVENAKFSVEDETEAEEDKKRKKPKAVAPSKPIIAKSDLRRTMLSTFSIPEGAKAEIGAIIDGYADRLLREGSLTQEDRNALFDRMYSEGVMTVEADEFYRDGRQAVVGGRVYVTESEKAEFGDDWNDFRKRAFAAGVYLTNDRSDNHVDVWNMELADTLPGVFDREETDSKSILERVVQLAEEGKDEKMSLAEYTARLAKQEFIPESEFLDGMERQMDWALRTFAEKANLEIKLRERTGVKIAQERAERVEMAARQRERQQLRDLQQRTLKQLQWLSRNRFRAPEELRAAWDEVLGDIDIYAVGAANELNWSKKHGATWKDLAEMYKAAKASDPNFLPSAELERIVARLDGDKIADMDIGALQDLYKAAIGLRTEFYNRNNVINDEARRLFAEVYAEAKTEIETAEGNFTGKKLDAFLNMEHLTPMNVLERMAGWRKDGTWMSMARQLEQGERAVRNYKVRSQRVLEEFLTERADWVKTADGQGKDAIWYEVEVPELLELGKGDKPLFGKTVKVYMTPAQKVQLYLESKNTDNLRHMTGGRTFVDKELYSKGQRQEALAQGTTIRLAPETVKALVSDLTEEEMELARLLEGYYNQFAKGEINRVSNILYGYDKAQSKNYAPIFTNQNYTTTAIGVFDTTAEGVGHMKSRQYAVNPSYNISAFDAFERHSDQTARFVGMAIPARNWQTLLNWREKNNSTGDVITHKWGEEGKKYIDNLLNELQGGKVRKRDTAERILDTALSRYISSVFGFNPSIVLKQAMSFPLAGTYLGWENIPNIAKALKTPDALINTYTSELAYRLMGYATPETAQLKNNPSKLSENKVLKFTFGGGAITAMDGWTVKSIWGWAENMVSREHPELELGTQEQIDAGESPYYKEVAKAFEEAVSRSQPMYDVMHRAGIMRSDSKITRALTLFKTVPIQQYNMLRQTVAEAQRAKQDFAAGKVSEGEFRRARGKAGRAVVGVILAGLGIEAINFLNALLKNKAKRYRDDEDELTWKSAGAQATMNFVQSNAGMIAGGDILAEYIGSVVTGDKWYGVETPGVTQIVDLFEDGKDAFSAIGKLVQEGYDVVSKGGDMGEYLRRHGGDYLGELEKVCETAATYLGGVPANNIKAYALGALSWVSPEFATAYEDATATANKGKLSGLKGGALETRIGDILDNRVGKVEDETVETLAELYENGHTGAVPTDTPSSVSVNGEEKKLGAYQQQFFDRVWRECVAGALDDLVGSAAFQRADEETRAKMVKKLYDYAAQRAKTELFEGYAADKWVAEAAASGDVAEWIGWKVLSGDNSANFSKFREAGLGNEAALSLAEDIGELTPEAGKKQVSNLQKFRAIIDGTRGQDQQMAALSSVMGESEYARLQVGVRYGITPEMYVECREAINDTSPTQDEAKRAIKAMDGLTKTEAAILWQLQNKSWKPESNPFSKKTGRKVYNDLNAEDEKELEGLSLPSVEGDDTDWNDVLGLSLPTID